jgi:hypothetical protein
MASIARVNGTTQPVFASDVLNGNVSPSANIVAQGPVQVAGPKLSFYTFTANATLAAQGGVNGFVGNLLQQIQQQTTVAMYQVPTTTTIAVAVYPSGAFANVTLALAEAQRANSTIGISSATGTAAFTNVDDLPP